MKPLNIVLHVILENRYQQKLLSEQVLISPPRAPRLPRSPRSTFGADIPEEPFVFGKPTPKPIPTPSIKYSITVAQELAAEADRVIMSGDTPRKSRDVIIAVLNNKNSTINSMSYADKERAVNDLLASTGEKLGDAPKVIGKAVPEITPTEPEIPVPSPEPLPASKPYQVPELPPSPTPEPSIPTPPTPPPAPQPVPAPSPIQVPPKPFTPPLSPPSEEIDSERIDSKLSEPISSTGVSRSETEPNLLNQFQYSIAPVLLPQLLRSFGSGKTTATTTNPPPIKPQSPSEIPSYNPNELENLDPVSSSTEIPYDVDAILDKILGKYSSALRIK
ncbi:MAG: hypothetical protein H7831_06565 [Magnetococcus sp. WYHC-3]